MERRRRYQKDSLVTENSRYRPVCTSNEPLEQLAAEKNGARHWSLRACRSYAA
jgi:hypothetical protein